MMHDVSNLILCTDSHPTLLGIFDMSIAPSLLFYAYIPISLLSLLLGILVLRSGGDVTLKNKLFFSVTVIFSIHILNEIIQWIALPAGIIYFGWSISLLLKLLLLLSVTYFVYVFTTNRDLKFSTKILVSLVSLPIILFLPTQLNVSSFDIDWCGAIDGPLWIYLYLLQILTIFVLFVISFHKLSKFLHNKKKEEFQSFILLLSTCGFLTIFFGSEFFGDITTIFEINLIGPVGMLLFLSIITFIIVRYKAFNIKLIGAQALMLGIIALVGSQLFFVETTTNRILTTLTLLFSVLAGSSLIRSVRNEVNQREKIEKLAKNLEKVNARLKELDKQKSEFVSIASHQLRSPLTAIRGYASMLTEGSFGKLPDKAAESAKRIEESAKLMAMSIEDYLNVSRIESGNMKYNLSDFNLRDEVDHICDDLRPEAMARNLILLFRTDLKSRGVIHADIGKTVQIVHNLINNSLKYTPRGSISIFMRDDIKKKRIYVDIIDTGIGMSEQTLDTIFQKFERANNANSVNVSGTGLGLFVALKMAEAMGGTITAHSEGDGKGSRFTLEMPLAM